jgi:transcriptional regulator with XRE-family HTH domain
MTAAKQNFAARGETVLANLKAALGARGMRQADLALELKITPSVLSEIVNERRKANTSVRERVSKILQADESWLFSTFTRIPARAPSFTATDQPRAGERAE